MAQVEVKITIPDSEYEGWNEFAEDGVEEVKMSIRKTVSDALKRDYIRKFDIEVTHEK